MEVLCRTSSARCCRGRRATEGAGARRRAPSSRSRPSATRYRNDAEMMVAAGARPISLHVDVTDADRDDELEVVVVASNGTVAITDHAAVAAGATVIDGPDAAWTALPQCGGGSVNGSMVRLAGDAARLRRALAAVTYAPPSSVGMDGVRVIVRDGEGRCASAAADVHIKAAASSPDRFARGRRVHGTARG